jgi:DNA-binding NtrC family response regulator
MVRLAEHEFGVALVDLVLPDADGLKLLETLKGKDSALEVIIMTGHSSIAKAVEATKQGAFYFVAKPFDGAEMLTLIAKALERRRLLAETSSLRRQLAEQSGFGEILGHSGSMRRVFELLDSVAASDASVLIIGESGTGKELVANALHAKSARAGGPLVKINCAALPKDLIESELFGHVKGAFTGASTDKPGLLEEAHRGTVLLDEITEMPMDLQAKLLRVLEDRQVRRLGGGKSVAVDFRLLCSTNRDPEGAIREGQLRQDLYFRINTVTVKLPPLRERATDIPMLAKEFLDRFTAKHGRAVDGIDAEAYRRVLAYSWPGNVRELEHAIERAVLVARGPEITVADLPESLRVEPAEAAMPAAAPTGSLEQIERASIMRALDQTGWNKQAAAAILGLRRPTLYSKMRRHGIPQRRP